MAKILLYEEAFVPMLKLAVVTNPLTEVNSNVTDKGVNLDIGVNIKVGAVVFPSIPEIE